MTANILTPGHIKCLDYLTKKDSVIVGLLTSKALKGYKEELVPYKDREFVLDHVDVYGFAIVPQDSLDPSKNIQEYECDAIASSRCEGLRNEMIGINRKEEGLQGYARGAPRTPKFLNIRT